jgi:AcrR family transcriptional regulator
MAQKIENARLELMEAARKFLTFNKNGRLGRFDVRTITAQCGMATGTFYHYFSSKDDLVIQVMLDDWNKIITRIEKTTSGKGSLRSKIEVIYNELNRFESDYIYSAMRLITPTKEHIETKQRNEKMMYDIVKSFLQDEIECGDLELSADTDTASYMLVQILLSAGRNPNMSFDELWKCMNFRDNTAG